MHRNKFGVEYLTLPGGNIEVGESPEEALARELYEETQFKATNHKLVFIEHCEEPYGDQMVFLAETEGEEPQLMPGAEEELINKLGKNLYKPMWVPVDDLSNQGFVTYELRDHLLDGIKNGWPEVPVEFDSKRR